jgi:RNA polymerase sigma-70 factor (ECF subfamily)
MQDDSSTTRNLLERARGGDSQAMGELFTRHRGRLRHLVQLRLDRRLQGRVDPSDVLRETYEAYTKNLPDYARNPTLPLFLWLRHLTGQKLLDLHQRQLGAQAPAAGQDISLYHGALPEASSASLAAQLLGKLTTSSQKALRAEMQTRVQEVLNGMDAVDREILVLRHFEMLNNDEAAAVLGISKAAASTSFIRALKRLKDSLGP